MSQSTVRVASEEPEELLGGMGRVRKRSVCASEETEEAPGCVGGTRGFLAGFRCVIRPSGWLRSSQRSLRVAGEEQEVALGGFGRHIRSSG